MAGLHSGPLFFGGPTITGFAAENFKAKPGTEGTTMHGQFSAERANRHCCFTATAATGWSQPTAAVTVRLWPRASNPAADGAAWGAGDALCPHGAGRYWVPPGTADGWTAAGVSDVAAAVLCSDVAAARATQDPA